MKGFAVFFPNGGLLLIWAAKEGLRLVLFPRQLLETSGAGSIHDKRVAPTPDDRIKGLSKGC